MLRIMTIAAVLTAGLFAIAQGQGAANNLITKNSPLDVAATTEKLESYVAEAGAKVFAVIDHHGGAESIGEDIPEARLVIFGNPRAGTPLMQENILAGIDLPLRIFVWDEGGQTRVTYIRPEEIALRHGISPDHPSIRAMDETLAALTKRLAEETPIRINMPK